MTTYVMPGEHVGFRIDSFPACRYVMRHVCVTSLCWGHNHACSRFDLMSNAFRSKYLEENI